jgi:hypothetical protein
VKTFEESLIDLLDKSKEAISKIAAPYRGFSSNDFDKNESVRLSFLSKALTIISNDSENESSFNNDKLFNDASRLAGAWGSYRQVLWYLIYKCGKFKHNKFIIDKNDIIQSISSLQHSFSAKSIHVITRSLLFGVILPAKKLELIDGITLYRLSQKDRDYHLKYTSYTISESQTLLTESHSAEVRVTIDVPVARSENAAFFNAENIGVKLACNVTRNLLNALLLIKEGRIDLGPMITETDSPIQGIQTLGTYPIVIPLQSLTLRMRDIPKIATAYSLVSENSQQLDPILVRAIHRFLLGRKRLNLIDKLVDYVIGWESLLLTVKGEGASQELAYRFSVNGASLIGKASKTKERQIYFRKMNAIYSLRSSVVHAGDQKKIDKELRAGDFEDFDSACIFLEANFRKVIWYLMESPKGKRPYSRKNGWEELLWP